MTPPIGGLLVIQQLHVKSHPHPLEPLILGVTCIIYKHFEHRWCCKMGVYNVASQAALPGSCCNTRLVTAQTYDMPLRHVIGATKQAQQPTV